MLGHRLLRPPSVSGRRFNRARRAIGDSLDSQVAARLAERLVTLDGFVVAQDSGSDPGERVGHGNDCAPVASSGCNRTSPPPDSIVMLLPRTENCCLPGISEDETGRQPTVATALAVTQASTGAGSAVRTMVPRTRS